MGKTSNYEKRPRDFYPSPKKAVMPLVGHLPSHFWYAEPCAGDGILIEHLDTLFQATAFVSKDIEPQADGIEVGNGLDLTEEELQFCDYIITNPPFTWSVLSPLMDKWISLKPTVLLLPADFMHNIRFSKYLNVCTKIVSIGRVKWIEGSKTGGVENYAWYFFDKDNKQRTQFYGRPI